MNTSSFGFSTDLPPVPIAGGGRRGGRGEGPDAQGVQDAGGAGGAGKSHRTPLFRTVNWKALITLAFVFSGEGRGWRVHGGA